MDSKSKLFKVARKQNSSESAEDYTELVYDLIQESGVARTTDLARLLGISHVTALRTVRRLQLEGYLRTSRGKPIELTSAGKKLALYAKDRHRTLVDLFINLGVPAKTAEMDAEGAEHHISRQTLNCIKKYLRSRK